MEKFYALILWIQKMPKNAKKCQKMTKNAKNDKKCQRGKMNWTDDVILQIFLVKLMTGKMSPKIKWISLSPFQTEFSFESNFL